jgi:hypothetical protein
MLPLLTAIEEMNDYTLDLEDTAKGLNARRGTFINLLEIQGNKLFLSFNLSIAKYKRESLIS